MQLVSWTVLALFCLALPLTQAQVDNSTQDDAESVLDFINDLRSHLIARHKTDESWNTSCAVTGLKSRKIDLIELLHFHGKESENKDPNGKCGQIIEELEATWGSLAPNLKKSIESIDNNYLENLLEKLIDGKLDLTKDIAIGLLNNIQYPIKTPDVITLAENTVEEIRKPNWNISSFALDGENALNEILEGIAAQNSEIPEFNYQILQLMSSFENIRPPPLAHPLLLIKSDDYPADVIKARDELLAGLANGNLTVSDFDDWPRQPDQLLALLTKLTKIPNDNKLSASVHVLFAFYRMKYLSFEGYTFVPTQLADIAFLLNSFLTIRNREVINELFVDFSREDFPWSKLIAELDFSKYSNPRTLFLDMIEAILKHPENLTLCNTVLMKSFSNSNTDTPGWIKNILSPVEANEMPINLKTNFSFISNKRHVSCSNATAMIDPECLINIIDSKTHTQFIIDVLRYNPKPYAKYQYETRKAALLSVLDDIKNEKYNDDISDFVLTQAIRRLKINDKGKLPPKLINLCQQEIEELEAKSPVPNKPNNSGTPMPTSTPNYTLGMSPQMSSVPPIQPVQSTTPGCDKRLIIDPVSLLKVIESPQPFTLKNDVVSAPILQEKYKNLNTKKEVLLAVLKDRNEFFDQFIPIIEKIPFSKYAILPPTTKEVCINLDKELDKSGYIKNKTKILNSGCVQHETINPASIIEILQPSLYDELLHQLILKKPLLKSDYKNGDTRKGIFYDILARRSKEYEKWDVAYDILNAITRADLNEKADLPPQYLELCPCSNLEARASIINPTSLIEALDLANNDWVRGIITAKPIIADLYAPFNNRSSVLKLLLYGWTNDNSKVEPSQILSLLNGKLTNDKGELPVEISKDCVNTNLISKVLDESKQNLTDTCPAMNVPVRYVDVNSLLEIVNGDKTMCRKLWQTPILAVNHSSGTRGEILKKELHKMKLPIPSLNELETLPIKFKTCCVSLEESKIPLCTDHEQFHSTTERPKRVDKKQPIESIFDGVIEGLGETTIPCATTEAALTEPTTHSTGTAPETTNNTPVSVTETIKTSTVKPIDYTLLEESVLVTEPPKNTPQCPEGEILTTVVNITSLWGALTNQAPKAPFIRAKAESYILPLDHDKDYSRGEVLREILMNIKEDINETKIMKNIDLLLQCIRLEGPGAESPETYEMCLPVDALEDPDVSTTPICRSDEVLTTVVQTDTLIKAFSSDAPKAPYIRSKINSYLVPVDSENTYTKGDVLRDILVNLKDEVVDKRVMKNIEYLLTYIRKDGPALEEPDTVQMCISQESLAEEEKEEIETSSPISSYKNSKPELSKATSSTPPPVTITIPPIVSPVLPKVDPLSLVSTVVAVANHGPSISTPSPVVLPPIQPPMTVPPKIEVPVITTEKSNTQSTVVSPKPVDGPIISTPSPVVQPPIQPPMTVLPPVITTEKSITLPTVMPPNPVSPPKLSSMLPSPSPTVAPSVVSEGNTVIVFASTQSHSHLPLTVNSTESSIMFTQQSTTETPNVVSESVSPSTKESMAPTTSKTTSTSPPVSIVDILVSPRPTQFASAFAETSSATSKTPEATKMTLTPDDRSGATLQETSQETTTTPSSGIHDEECDEVSEENQSTEQTITKDNLHHGGHLNWPSLLKIVKNEQCTDELTKNQTSPVQMVNITELLSGSKGNEAAVYVTTALLAGIDTYHKLETFNMLSYKTKESFFNALSNHLGGKLHLKQESNDEITVSTLCSEELTKMLPTQGWRNKRSVENCKGKCEPAQIEITLQQAFKIAYDTFLKNKDKILNE